jgi:hypothetical protein
MEDLSDMPRVLRAQQGEDQEIIEINDQDDVEKVPKDGVHKSLK